MSGMVRLDAIYRTLRSRPFDVIAILFAAGIIIASFSPPPEIDAGRGTDKFLHIAAYGTLSLFALLQRRTCISAIIVMVVIVILSGVVELFQPFVGREREAADFLANAAGASIGAFGAWRFHRFKLMRND